MWEKAINEEFVERCKNLKKTGNIFNPIFYIVFTRLVEVSSIINEVFLATPEDLEEMFKTRKDLLEIDLKTINETLRRAWKFEIERGVKYNFSDGIEDLMYVVYRMREIQSTIDEMIKSLVKEWKKSELVDIYFSLLVELLELEEKIQKEVEREIALENFVRLAKELGYNSDFLVKSYEILKSENKPINHVRLEEVGEKSKLSELLAQTDEEEKRFVLSALKVIFGKE
ncbi:hypothetical protein Ferp_0891 [Ferroglobus placidus DSM 10642]|uniref:Uncharacterized protein n=1 Tax=Ferroglobus placidus (strain DSM 10642 / AEDII12DO) TaxID=589924 RepID=D3RX46_FERPA|nr:hypothetical protein [Ferroglobus placidus]ADC65059.1 hypothetical protein Ferp_0891 [Ferroglobus placidus DSM 10642]